MISTISRPRPAGDPSPSSVSISDAIAPPQTTTRKAVEAVVLAGVLYGIWKYMQYFDKQQKRSHAKYREDYIRDFGMEPVLG